MWGLGGHLHAARLTGSVASRRSGVASLLLYLLPYLLP